MAHSLPTKETNNSAHHLFSTCTMDLDDGLHIPSPSSCGTWQSPGQVTRQHNPYHQSPSSNYLRSPELSHENSDDEDSPASDYLGNSVIGAIQPSTDHSREEIDDAQGLSRVTMLPQRPWEKCGKLFNKFRNHRRLRAETPPVRSTSVDIFKIWKWEILSSALAIGTLGSMYGILYCYDGQRTPDWGIAINLSTLLALMATILRTMLVFVVSEIIGQAKWKYFAGGGPPKDNAPVRRLIETNRFNDASQGSLGAVKLIPTVLWDPATLLAVMIMVISLGMGSFVQQSIQTQSCYFAMDSVEASLPISRNMTLGWTRGRIVGDPLDGPNMLAAISSALAPDREDLASPISIGCPTGNCTFKNPIGGVYSTLGVCSSCSDTSSLITSFEWTYSDSEQITTRDGDSIPWLTRNYTLPNGMSVKSDFDRTDYEGSGMEFAELLVSASPESGLGWAGDLVSAEMTALSQWAFANVTVLSPTWLRTSSGYTDYVAATCTLYPCLRSYNASVTSGKLGEDLVSTIPAVLDVAAVLEPGNTIKDIEKTLFWLNETDYMYWSEYVWENGSEPFFQTVQSPCVMNDTVWTKENKSFTLDMQRLVLLHADPTPSGARGFKVEDMTAPTECIYGMEFLVGLSFSSYMTATSFNGSCSAWSHIDGADELLQLTCHETNWLSAFYISGGTTADGIIKQIEAFTDRLSNKMRMGLLNKPEDVYGQVLQATVCSRIDYSWLAFPGVLVAVTSGLLPWTMFQSSRRRCREMVWKTSILPFLFYGERFVVQNGEDVSGHSNGSLRSDGTKEPLLSLDQMEEEARQRKVRFDVS